IASNVYGFIVQAIYLSFALDSLLKVDIGVRVHLGILSLLILNIAYFIAKGEKQRLAIPKSDKWLVLFALYILLNGLFKLGLQSLYIFLYFFLALNIYFFIR